MITVEVAVAMSDCDDVALIATIERICLAESLTLSLRGTLTSYPGCTHWHLKYGQAPGTLELTWWPARKRLWFKVASNRQSKWIESKLPVLKAKLEATLCVGNYRPSD